MLTAGEVGPSLGMKSAVWVFDMLRYEFRDLHLVIAGGGPDAAGLEDFRRAVAYDDTRVRYAGPRADLRSLVAVAEQVWVLQPRGGLNFGFYRNEAFDQLADAQRAEMDAAKRQQLVREAQVPIVQDSPTLTLFHRDIIHAYNKKRFSGVTPILGNGIGFPYMPLAYQNIAPLTPMPK